MSSYTSAQFSAQMANLQKMWFLRPLLESKPLPVLGRLYVALDAALLVLLAAIIGMLMFSPAGPASTGDVVLLAALAFIIGAHLEPSVAAASFGQGLLFLPAALFDRFKVLLRKREFDRQCERIGRALNLRSDYLPQRVKIWLGYLVRTYAFASHPSFMRMLAARSTQAQLCEMELAENLIAAIENGATDPASALRTALQGCRWMDPNAIEQAAQADVPAVA